MSLAKVQVLRGPLVYLGLIEVSPFFPYVHHRQVFSTFVIHCAHCFMASEPQMTTEDCIGSMMNLIWIPFETVDAWLEAPFFWITFRSQPRMGLSNLQFVKPLRLTFRSFCRANSWRFPSRNGMKWFLRFHARFTVIVGLLPVIVQVFRGSVHARFTLAIFGPWQFIYHAFVVVPALDSQW